MGRILVIHPQTGLLDLVQRVMASGHNVEVFTDYYSAANHLTANGAFDAVLCGLDEAVRPFETFEQALAKSSATRLIPIATNEAEFVSFCEEWNSVPRRKQ